MVIVRLARGGAKKRPYYHITVADSRRARDSKYIERVGFYNPIASGQDTKLDIDYERLEYWVSKGAQISDTVKNLVKISKFSPEQLEKYEARKEVLRLSKLEKKKSQASKKTEDVAAEGAESSGQEEEKTKDSTEGGEMEKTEDIIDKVAEEVEEAAEEVAEPAEAAAEEVVEEVAEPAEEVVEEVAEPAEAAEGVAEPAEEVAEPAEEVVENTVDAVKDALTSDDSKENK